MCFRLTETSAGVAEQLQSTKQMANDLMEAQTLALQAQKEILTNGEQLKVTLRDSTEGKHLHPHPAGRFTRSLTDCTLDIITSIIMSVLG